MHTHMHRHMQTRHPHTTMHMYKSRESAPAKAGTSAGGGTSGTSGTSGTLGGGKKRKQEDTDIDNIGLEVFLLAFKKDTLQSMCEDIDIPVSGNKPDVIARIMKANNM